MLTTNTHCQISSKVSHQNGMDVTNNKLDLEVPLCMTNMYIALHFEGA